MSSPMDEPTKKPPKKKRPPKKKPVAQKVEYDLTKPQKIPITSENFELLLNFCTGKFPEIYGLPEQREHVAPAHCPFCRFHGGYDYISNLTEARVRHSRIDDALRLRRAVRVQCLSCGRRYTATETWSIAYELETQT